jgi:hypothetical protein
LRVETKAVTRRESRDEAAGEEMRVRGLEPIMFGTFDRDRDIVSAAALDFDLDVRVPERLFVPSARPMVRAQEDLVAVFDSRVLGMGSFCALLRLTTFWTPAVAIATPPNSISQRICRISRLDFPPFVSREAVCSQNPSASAKAVRARY